MVRNIFFLAVQYPLRTFLNHDPLWNSALQTNVISITLGLCRESLFSFLKLP